MILAAYILIAAPFVAALIIAISLDERYEISDRIAATRAGRKMRRIIDRYIDGIDA